MLAPSDLNFKKTFYQLSHTNEVTLVENTVERCQTKYKFSSEIHTVCQKI